MVVYRRKRTYACRNDTMERIFAETKALRVLLYACMLANRNMYEAVLPYRRHSRHETHGKGVSFFFPLPVFLGAAFSGISPLLAVSKARQTVLVLFCVPLPACFPQASCLRGMHILSKTFGGVVRCMIAFRSVASASGSISRTQAQPCAEPHVILGSANLPYTRM